MSAFVFQLNAAGDVCGGYADTSDRSGEGGFKLHGCPVRPLADCGVEIAWPDGAPFEYAHTTGTDATHPEEAL